MRRYLLIIGLTLFSLSGFSQFVPTTSQAFQFYSIYNPSFSGIDAYHDIRLSYRYQWAGLEGAPRYVNLSYNTRLKQPLDLSSNALHVSNPNLVKIPSGKLSIHGFGVNVFQLTSGQVKSQGANLNYAFHFPLGQSHIAFGVGAFFESTKINLDGVETRDPDPFLENLKKNGSSKTELSLRVGALFYSRSFYFGLSYLPVWQTLLQSPGELSSNTFYTGSAQIGYSFLVSPTFYLKPSVVALLLTNSSFNVDYNIKAFVGDRVWFGLSYRDIQAGVGLVGFNINDTFTASYSYEMSLGKFKSYNSGSHELVLVAKLNNFRRQSSYAW
jgi:type IX secretion system PorP/SprF family membrane protein